MARNCQQITKKYRRQKLAVKRKSPQGIKKGGTQTPLRRSARLESTATLKESYDRSPASPVTSKTQSKLHRDLSAPLRIGRKRLCEPEDSLPAEHLRKRSRQSSIHPPSKYTLGEEVAARYSLTQSNLEKFDELSARSAQEKMDAGSVAYLRGRGSGRPPQASGRRPSRSQSRHSRRSATAEFDLETSTQRSQKTSCTAANYRFIDLESARIYIEAGLPPEEVQKCIEAVVQSEISPARKEELKKLADDFCRNFLTILRGAAGEDDCVEVLYKTLSYMFPGDKFMHSRNADWRPVLKPRTRSSWDFSFLDETGNDPNDDALPGEATEEVPNETVSRVIPRKRAQAATEYLSPQQSFESVVTDELDIADEAPAVNEAMPPPPPPARSQTEIDDSPIKTPRPDITIGISQDVLVQELHRIQGLDRIRAKYFLKDLQQKTIRRDSGRRREPVLCSEPTQRALQIRFPFLVIEGKSYATGKHIFDAENQAAASGACALKIQHDLNYLVQRASPSKDAPSQRPHLLAKIPLVFSICTQGPFHELWAHYAIMEGNIREFYMAPIKTCRAPILDEVLQWLMWVDNVMTWGAGEFLEGVVERLGTVARRAGSGGA